MVEHFYMPYTDYACVSFFAMFVHINAAPVLDILWSEFS